MTNMPRALLLTFASALLIDTSGRFAAQADASPQEPDLKSTTIPKIKEAGLELGFPRRSIRQWAACDGVSDDRAAVDAAFRAASHASFTLLIDCPVRIHTGMNIDRPIFFDDDTRVVFTKSGLFIVDNVMVPTWVIANTSRVTLQGWRVRYEGGMPTDPDTGGYGLNGRWVAQSGFALPAYRFNDQTLTRWLGEHRNITFGRGAAAIWAGPTNASAVIFITGSSNDVTIRDMKMFVPPEVGVNRFIPVVFQSNAGWRSNLKINRETAMSAANAAVPSRVRVSGLDIDGSYMGWVGALRDSSISNVISRRYGDLEGPHQKDTGGKEKWFAPPHLLYLIGYPNFPGLQNNNIRITNVLDQGLRLGLARDRKSPPLSGYAPSLKIGANNSTVDNYVSHRPDGLLDLIQSDGLSIRNIRGTFDSSFLNNVFPGIRFPLGPYRNVLLEHVFIEDLAKCPVLQAVGGVTGVGNRRVKLRDVIVSSVATKATRKVPSISSEEAEVDVKFRARRDDAGNAECSDKTSRFSWVPTRLASLMSR